VCSSYLGKACPDGHDGVVKVTFSTAQLKHNILKI
jgi:hypothetical protein